MMSLHSEAIPSFFGDMPLKLVSALAIAAAMTFATNTPAIAQDGIPGPEEDSYIWLEEARSDRALDWVRAENERTTELLAGDPRFDAVKAEALAIYDSEDRIPYVSIRPDGLYNFWQDKQNPRGLVRRTTLESYRTDNPQWETVLDVDALANAEGREWVYKGYDCLPPEERLCMIALSDGGEDATVLREFDMSTKSFVDGGFVLDQKSQGGIQWLDKDTLLVSRDFGEGTLTESQYPRTTRVWKRGTPIDQAEEIWRGEEADVWSGATLLRDHTGTVHGTYAFRATSFHETEYFWQKDGEWLRLDMPLKAAPYGLIDGQLLFSTDVDWETQGQTFPADALISVDLAEFKADPNGATKTLVWAPEAKQTKQGAANTAESLYVSLLDNVRGRVLKFDYVDGKWVSTEIALPDNSTLGVAAASDGSDEIMYSVTDFLTPSTLYYSDGSGAPEVIKTSPSNFDATGMEVEQFEATSADGTKIPYFLVKPKGMVLDGTNPTLLTGYGGFQVPRLPSYLGSIGKIWVERGGAYILGNMRGAANSARTGTSLQFAKTSSAPGTISLLSRKTRSHGVSPVPSTLVSRVARRADCWSAPPSPSDLSYSTRQSSRSRCSTCCAITRLDAARRGSANMAIHAFRNSAPGSNPILPIRSCWKARITLPHSSGRRRRTIALILPMLARALHGLRNWDRIIIISKTLPVAIPAEWTTNNAPDFKRCR